MFSRKLEIRMEYLSVDIHNTNKDKMHFFEDEYFKSELFYFLWSNFVIDYILFKIKLVFQWIGVEKT